MFKSSRGRTAPAGTFALVLPRLMPSSGVVLCGAFAGLLCACDIAPTVHTSSGAMGYTSAPTSASDPRLGQPKFYSDEGDNAWWTHASTPGTR